MAMYKNGVWWTESVIDGVRRTERTDYARREDKPKVKKLQAQRRAVHVAKAAEVAAQTVRNKRGKVLDQPVHDAFAAYWQLHLQHAKGAQNLLRELAYAEAYFGPEMPISHIDAEAMIGLREARRKDTSKRKKTPTPISNRTVNITLETIKNTLSWLRKNGREVCVIDWSVVLLECEDRVTEFTAAHEVLVRKEFRADMLSCLEFMLLCGPRKTQAVELRWTDVDLDRGVIRLIKQKKRGARRSPKPHIVPITRQVEALLLAQIDPETKAPYHLEFVWTYVGERTRVEKKSGREIIAGRRYPITVEGLSSQWVRFKKEHGLMNVRIHDMRHYAGTRIYAETRNPLVIRDMLGHSNLSVTERYMHLTVEEMRAALDRRAYNENAER
jgi:integrase